MAIVDIATLKAYFENGDAPTEAQFANLIDSMFWKTYQTDVAYANGTPAVTINNATYAKVSGLLIPYKTSDGQWWMKGTVNYTHGSQASMEVEISGVSAIGAGEVFPCSCYYCNQDSGVISDKTSSGVFIISIDHPLAYGAIHASFDVPIAGKPTWAD